MANGTVGGAVVPQPFSDHDVLEASFRLEVATEGSEPARKLFLRSYRRADAQVRTWYAMPEEEWPLLAIILPNRIIMRPIHVNPHAQRYLTPKNGRFTTVIYVDDYGDEMLNDAEAAASRIDLRLAWGLFDPPGNRVLVCSSATPTTERSQGKGHSSGNKNSISGWWLRSGSNASGD